MLLNEVKFSENQILDKLSELKKVSRVRLYIHGLSATSCFWHNFRANIIKHCEMTESL